MAQRSDCRLTAIVSIDLFGYSRLMELDEIGTHQAWMTCRREILGPTVTSHSGHIVKSTGDGALITFPSALEAVHGMIDFQRRMVTWGGPLRADQRLVFRAGIHVAATIVEDGDLYGNGVNLAVRLQEAADPGSIFLSRVVVDHVKGHSNLRFESLGKKALKNIKKPMPIYRWRGGRTRALQRRHTRLSAATALAFAVFVYPFTALQMGQHGLDIEGPWTTRAKPASHYRTRIEVQPFTHQSADSEPGHLMVAFPKAIATDLARNTNLFVFDSSDHPSQDQGHGYVLEGTIQHDTDGVRVRVQLKDNSVGNYVWTEDFDDSSADLSALEDRIARRVASSVAVALRASERISQSRSENAYDAYLQAVAHYGRNTPADLRQAVRDLEEALRWDPDYGRAHALLAAVYWASWQNRWRIDTGMAASTALKLAQHHLNETDEPAAMAHVVMAEMLTASGHHAEAIAEAERAIVLEPEAAAGYHAKGIALIFDGRPGEAEDLIRAAIQLDPHAPRYLFGLALAEFSMERFQDALATLTRATTRNAKDDWPFLLLAATFGYLGRGDDARDAIANFDDLSMQLRGWSSHHLPYVHYWPFRRDRDRQRLHKGLLQAGIQAQFRVAVRQ